LRIAAGPPGLTTMIYFVKWKKRAGDEPLEMKCDTIAGAKQYAFAKISWPEKAYSVWIENEKGELLFDDAAIRRHHNPKD
jgi:hypothetical protein